MDFEELKDRQRKNLLLINFIIIFILLFDINFVKEINLLWIIRIEWLWLDILKLKIFILIIFFYLIWRYYQYNIYKVWYDNKLLNINKYVYRDIALNSNLLSSLNVSSIKSFFNGRELKDFDVYNDKKEKKVKFSNLNSFNYNFYIKSDWFKVRFCYYMFLVLFKEKFLTETRLPFLLSFLIFFLFCINIFY